MSDSSKYQGKTYEILAPAVVLGEGSSATYLYRGGIVPAGFASDEQIEHHLAIKAIKEIDLDLTPAADPGDGVVGGDGTAPVDPEVPTDLIDGKGFEDWRLEDLRTLVKAEGIALEGATSKADVYRKIVAVRADQ